LNLWQTNTWKNTVLPVQIKIRPNNDIALFPITPSILYYNLFYDNFHWHTMTPHDWINLKLFFYCYQICHDPFEDADLETSSLHCEELWGFYKDELLGRSLLLSRSANVVHVLGSVTVKNVHKTIWNSDQVMATWWQGLTFCILWWNKVMNLIRKIIIRACYQRGNDQRTLLT